MPTPATRTPVRIARGTYSNLNASILDLQEGEICYVTDENKIYVVEGGVLTTLPYGAGLDTAQTWTAGQRGEVTALTDAATIAINFADSNHFSVTLGGNRTLGNPTNLTAGQSGCIWITQDGSGSRVLSYSSYWDFTGGTAPTLTTTANARDCLVYAVQSATQITAQLITNLS
jgi:hypothetical protein